MKRFIGPIIEERRRLMQNPDYEKPVHFTLVLLTQVDFLQWLIDSAEGSEATINALCMRISLINFSSIHTTSIVKSPPPQIPTPLGSVLPFHSSVSSLP